MHWTFGSGQWNSNRQEQVYKDMADANIWGLFLSLQKIFSIFFKLGWLKFSGMIQWSLLIKLKSEIIHFIFNICLENFKLSLLLLQFLTASSEFRNLAILILKELTLQMHAMVEQLHCLIVLTGLKATHGMGVMDLLFAQTVR